MIMRKRNRGNWGEKNDLGEVRIILTSHDPLTGDATRVTFEAGDLVFTLNIKELESLCERMRVSMREVLL